MFTPTTDEVRALYAPHTPEEFFSKYWEKQSLYIPGPRDKFAGLFSRAEFERAVAEGAMSTRQHRHFSVRGLRSQSGRSEDEAALPLDARQMRTAFNLGMSICVNDISAESELLSQMAARVKTRLGLTGYVRFNAYLSAPGEGIDTHFDARHATILQIEGSKRWWYGTEPAVQYPRTNALVFSDGTAAYVDKKDNKSELVPPEPSSFHEVVLQPGDVLYLPPGTWHRTSAVEESLSLNLAIGTFSFLDLAKQMLDDMFLDQVAFRRNLPAVMQLDGMAPMSRELREHLASCLTTMTARLAELAPAGLPIRRAWRRAQVELEAPVVLRRRHRRTARRPATEVLRVADPRPLTYEVNKTLHGAADVYVYREGKELHMTPELLPLLKACALRTSFSRAELNTWPEASALGSEALERALERFIETGILEYAEPNVSGD